MCYPVLGIHWFVFFPQFLKSVLKVRKILHEWSAGIFPSQDPSTGSFPELRGTFLFCPFLLHLKKDKKWVAIKGIKKPTNPAVNSTAESCCFTQTRATAFKPLSFSWLPLRNARICWRPGGEYGEQLCPGQNLSKQLRYQRVLHGNRSVSAIGIVAFLYISFHVAVTFGGRAIRLACSFLYERIL